jgi:hypothetical protein
MVKLENEEIEIPKGWFSLQPYNYINFERKLDARYAASNENSKYIQRSNDFNMYLDARKKY